MRELVLEKLRLLVQQRISQHELDYTNPRIDVYLDEMAKCMVFQLQAEIMKHKHEKIRADYPTMIMPMMDCPTSYFQEPLSEFDQLVKRWHDLEKKYQSLYQ